MAQIICEGIHFVGAVDKERKLFDELIPLPKGTSYNSYLVIGTEKTALIDTVDPVKQDALLRNLKALGVHRIDYVVANHAEQDHSGAIHAVLEAYPEATVLCSDKCRQMLIEHLHIDAAKIRAVKDRETISLGERTLEFIYTPWVHWPETMCTYLQEDKVLFSCDFFGSHYAFDDIEENNPEMIQTGTKMYFAEIMMPFRGMIKNNLAKLSACDISIIAPSHGCIHKEPKLVIDAYNEWISDDAKSLKNLAVICYVSMHGSTRLAAETLASELEKLGVGVRMYNLTDADIGSVATDMVDAATLVIGTPCVLGGIHPVAANILYLTNLLKPKTRHIGIFGSFGWGGRIAEEMGSIVKGLRAEEMQPVLFKGMPTVGDKNRLRELAYTIAERHHSIGKR